ncbi:MAG TPA: ABC transporter permease, partial [Candidatus Dormibacteraeota bacterium]|nr:ABC transporter permease [Candidatus Dormibacteraeota bacterium]
MLRVALRQLAGQRTATLLILTALLAAALGASTTGLVTAAATATLQGDIARAWQSPFDLLVRPQGSRTALESRDSLLRPNYATGIRGGITLAQLAKIRAVSGVQVAAPLAVVGATEWPTDQLTDLEPLMGGQPLAVFRVGYSLTSDAGMSSFTGPTNLLAVTTTGEIRWQPVADSRNEPVLHAGGMSIRCRVPDARQQPLCLARTVRSPDGTVEQDPRFALTASTELSEPLVLAGIDPVAEAQISGLDHCVVSGHYLAAGQLRSRGIDNPDILSPDAGIPGDYEHVTAAEIPILASTTSPINERLTVRVERAADVAAPGLVNGGGTWIPVSSTSVDAQTIYKRSLADLSRYVLTASLLLSPGEVTYDTVSSDHLRVRTVDPDLSVYFNSIFALEGGPDAYAPLEAHDAWFRQLAANQWDVTQRTTNTWRVDGTYDPACVRGFDPLVGGRLNAFAPAEVRLPSGATLGPSRALGGYVNPPPVMLTTLQGAAFFANPAVYKNAVGDAFISLVRVKVAGIPEAGPAAEAKLAKVAADISAATGLVVDVVKGASQKSIQVDLPAGRFGRPALTVVEGWAVKGVAVRFAAAAAGQQASLVALDAVGAGLLVAQIGYVSVRRRRRELAVLRALGWSTARISALVETQMVVLALCATVIALMATLPFTWRTLLHAGPFALMCALALPALIAVLAGIPAAIAASRGRVRTAMAEGSKPFRSRPLRRPFQVGLRELLRLSRWRLVSGIAIVGLAASLLGALVLTADAFNGRLDTTVLGAFLGEHVQAYHFLIAGLLATLGAIAVAQLITIGYLDR